MGWTKNIASFVSTAKMFCPRASARLRPTPHTQYSLGAQGHNLYEVLGRVGPGRGEEVGAEDATEAPPKTKGPKS